MAQFPKLYAILDRSGLAWEKLLNSVEELVSAGITLLQYRNRAGDSGTMLAESSELKRRVGFRAKLIMNDRADLCLAAELDGVHVGQDDLSPASARMIIGPTRWLGVSAHNPAQIAEADRTPADYVAIGPIFPTASKANPEPTVGLAGVRRARRLTGKPLVAIGGITRGNCLAVIEAGADSVAVISDLIPEPGKSAEEFMRILG
jgi:thiamine-phosphate pyrophosphorylase